MIIAEENSRGTLRSALCLLMSWHQDICEHSNHNDPKSGPGFIHYNYIHIYMNNRIYLRLLLYDTIVVSGYIFMCTNMALGRLGVFK